MRKRGCLEQVERWPAFAACCEHVAWQMVVSETSTESIREILIEAPLRGRHAILHREHVGDRTKAQDGELIRSANYCRKRAIVELLQFPCNSRRRTIACNLQSLNYYKDHAIVAILLLHDFSNSRANHCMKCAIVVLLSDRASRKGRHSSTSSLSWPRSLC